MSPASVDDPEPRFIYCFVDVEEALVLQNTQRDEAERRHSEVGSVSDLFSEPMLHQIDQPDGLNCIVGGLSRQPHDEGVGWEPIVLIEDTCPIVDDFLPFARAEGFHLQRHILADELSGAGLKSRLDADVLVILRTNCIRYFLDEFWIRCRRRCCTMGRVGVSDPPLGHHCLEEVHYRLVVRHEPVLVLELVEENILTMNPDVGVSNLPVDRDLSLNLVRGVVFCRAQIWLAELAIAAATSHNLDKPMS